MKKILILAGVLSVILSGCNTAVENSATAFLMNTVVNIKADAPYDTVNGALELCRGLDKKLSRTDEGSEIYKLNAAGSAQVSADTADLIKSALSFCELTNGRLDITVGKLSDTWNFSSATDIPSPEKINEALKTVNYKNIEVSGESIKTNGSMLDLGAVAKGYACNKVKEYFEQNGIKNAVANLGGNVLVMGEDDYTVGIKNPFKTDEIYAKIKVKNTSVVTSGTYERYIESGGKKYHHILDTSTGYPADTDIVSVSVICGDSLKADAYSTICLIYGSEAALELINATENIECIIITKDGEIKISSGIFCEDGVYRL
ncbi:MAG: FAD:protein FMN transferase [Clostridiales bacterium]|nr:FAD:protein FMN transferase [Candidatus Equinaster intestinalis]